MHFTFTSLPKLFVDKMIKIWMNSHIKVLTQLSKVLKCNKENQQVEQLYIARGKWGIFELCRFFKTMPCNYVFS